MPEISRFLGSIITMYYRDHRPPHFHAKYGSYEIVVSIADDVVEGRFPRRALQHVLEWYAIHRQALLENWELAEQRKSSSLFRPWSNRYGSTSLCYEVHRGISPMAPV